MKIMSFSTQHCLNHTQRNIDFDIMAKAITDYGADDEYQAQNEIK